MVFVLGKDLGQAGNNRFNIMTIGVFVVFLFELFDEVRPFWSRTDEAHVAVEDVEDVEDLRQFVEPSGADEFADFYFFPMAVVWPSATPAVLSFMKKIFTVAKMILISSTRLGLAIYMRSIRSLS